MKQILILGAGLVARPAARYLLEKGGVRVILADQAVEKADAIIDGHANGRAVHLDVEDTESLGRHVSAADIVVSLLPWTLHPAIARALPDPWQAPGDRLLCQRGNAGHGS
jgi:saccharopine dehydrogenase-like NADP-dependent oxidoreductase